MIISQVFLINWDTICNLDDKSNLEVNNNKRQKHKGSKADFGNLIANAYPTVQTIFKKQV